MDGFETTAIIRERENASGDADAGQTSWGKAGRWGAHDDPATVGSHMTNTDSGPFVDLIPAISLRENQRGTEIGSGWDPQMASADRRVHHLRRQGLRLGLNAAQTTLGAVGQLTGATLRK